MDVCSFVRSRPLVGPIHVHSDVHQRVWGFVSISVVVMLAEVCCFVGSERARLHISNFMLCCVESGSRRLDLTRPLSHLHLSAPKLSVLAMNLLRKAFSLLTPAPGPDPPPASTAMPPKRKAKAVEPEPDVENAPPKKARKSKTEPEMTAKVEPQKTAKATPRATVKAEVANADGELL